jgi:hypothetical protein
MLTNYPINTLINKIEELQKERKRIKNCLEWFEDEMTTQACERIDTLIDSLETAVKLLREFTKTN